LEEAELRMSLLDTGKGRAEALSLLCWRNAQKGSAVEIGKKWGLGVWFKWFLQGPDSSPSVTKNTMNKNQENLQH
jgi:hypothetical protein